MSASTTNSTAKLVRIALASAVGSLLWAGCTQPHVAVVDPKAIAHAPVDLTKRRPDTHPELRSGMWQMTTRENIARTVATPNITAPRAAGTVDSTELLSYNPEVINSVPADAQSSIIVEAAGAERPRERRTWRERWFQRRKPVQTIEREQREEVIIEQETTVPAPPPAPAPVVPAEPYKPSSDQLDDDDGGAKLLDTLFVRRN